MTEGFMFQVRTVPSCPLLAFISCGNWTELRRITEINGLWNSAICSGVWNVSEISLFCKVFLPFWIVSCNISCGEYDSILKEGYQEHPERPPQTKNGQSKRSKRVRISIVFVNSRLIFACLRRIFPYPLITTKQSGIFVLPRRSRRSQRASALKRWLSRSLTYLPIYPPHASKSSLPLRRFSSILRRELFAWVNSYI